MNFNFKTLKNIKFFRIFQNKIKSKKISNYVKMIYYVMYVKSLDIYRKWKQKHIFFKNKLKIENLFKPEFFQFKKRFPFLPYSFSAKLRRKGTPF